MKTFFIITEKGQTRVRPLGAEEGVTILLRSAPKRGGELFRVEEEPVPAPNGEPVFAPAEQLKAGERDFAPWPVRIEHLSPVLGVEPMAYVPSGLHREEQAVMLEWLARAPRRLRVWCSKYTEAKRLLAELPAMATAQLFEHTSTVHLQDGEVWVRYYEYSRVLTPAERLEFCVVRNGALLFSLEQTPTPHKVKIRFLAWIDQPGLPDWVQGVRREA